MQRTEWGVSSSTKSRVQNVKLTVLSNGRVYAEPKRDTPTSNEVVNAALEELGQDRCPTAAEVAAYTGLSYSTARNHLRKIREREHRVTKRRR